MQTKSWETIFIIGPQNFSLLGKFCSVIGLRKFVPHKIAQIDWNIQGPIFMHL